MRRWLIVLMAALVLMPGAAMAQESTPAAHNLGTLMPGSYLFGDTWSSSRFTPYAAAEDYFTEGLGAFFGGPNGARVTIVLLRNQPDRASMNEAWDLLSGWIDDDAFNNLFSVDFGRESALEDEDLPAGVADAVRIDGTDGFMNYPLCSGAYAIEPDLMVFIRAQGRITLTAGANAGINACDKIAGFVASQYPG